MFLYTDPKRKLVTKIIGFYPVAGNAYDLRSQVQTFANAFAVYKNSGLRCPLTIEPRR